MENSIHDAKESRQEIRMSQEYHVFQRKYEFHVVLREARRGALQDLKEDHSEAVHVGGVSIGILLAHFWGHPYWSPYHLKSDSGCA